MPETSIRGLKQRIRMRFPSHSLRHRLPHHHGRPSAASQPDFTTEPFVAAEPVPDPPRVPPVSRFPMAHLSEQLKERGNQLFKHGDYVAAEALYTQAIQKNPNNPLLFTNRANARMKLESWELAIDDCLKSIELLRDNLKAYTFLARAQLALKHPNEALSSALVAYDLCIRSKTLTKDAQTISALVLQCKKAKWEGRERERLRRKSPLLAELEDKIELASNQELASINERADKGELGEIAASEEREEVAKRTAQKLEDLRNIFAIADPDNMSKKEVPDYLIDNITFEIMHDPVVTKTGHSYERATLIEHLKRSPYDPLTREPLKIEDLRTNILLRDACNDFFEKNSGWVYDW
ncbi:hypothetical protein HDK77DRAFT_32077 [Phyllosticta capitalensis]|uniref:uncharacterized protein n=1 Tax=Phyllosticta capitalensis TaxID=121624 RepID=UPI00312F18FE